MESMNFELVRELWKNFTFRLSIQDQEMSSGLQLKHFRQMTPSLRCQASGGIGLQTRPILPRTGPVPE
jgi:hypothetical protein